MLRRTRFEYWSSSKLSHKIREYFNLPNPYALTMEEWNEHHEECKKKHPFIHWLTDEGFNKVQNIVMFPSDLVWTFKTATIWKFFRNLWLFRKCLWNYRSWDYSGLLEFMETATKDMSNYHREHGHLVRSMDTAKELAIVSKLCERIRKDDYSTERLDYIRKGEKKSFLGSFKNKPNTLPSHNAKSFYKLCSKMKKSDMELLGKIISRKLTSFWD